MTAFDPHDDPAGALIAVRRGLVIARDSGNRDAESSPAINLAHLEATHGDPLAAFEYFTVGIRNYHDAGNTNSMRAALAPFAACLDRQGCYESAATIAGFAFIPLSPLVFPVVTTTIAHRRDILGDPTYELLARQGETKNAAAMVTYAYDQIDQARAELNAVSNETTSATRRSPSHDTFCPTGLNPSMYVAGDYAAATDQGRVISGGPRTSKAFRRNTFRS
jgi:flagellin-like hook-associated protein FlgL